MNLVCLINSLGMSLLRMLPSAALEVGGRLWRFGPDGRPTRRSFTTCADSSLLRQVSVGEGVPLPTPRIQVVHGKVPQKGARKTLPAPSGILSRPAHGELRCRPLPT